ncbi:AAA family ATPase [Desulfobulbus alkaliphilus]|uniref:AAA family ATPase n=1 Tax=Desulfobulbus alkaliphilus TaxID=869814 RepID=UPI0019631223|nr:AAA family ATPase [Desulfobulbus alkaliphilus]MBM9537845.1 AAA family ATPase [Desulfobulbus alkaliphilus]
MYLEHFHLSQSPFGEEPDPEIFFPEAGREEVRQSLILDILKSKPIIRLIGREGYGKTLICQAVINRLPGQYGVVYIDNPVGAFDDLLRIVCLDLGMDPSGGHEGISFSDEMLRLLRLRKEAGRKTVLCIDEAEKLFLATLERLVRNVSEKWKGLGLTVVLSGRPGLDANFEQLAAFTATVDTHTSYTLQPLNEHETAQYLRFRLQAAGLSVDRHGDVFTDGAVAKIFASSQGNPRMINILAEESLQVSCSEKSFMVLLDHVDSQTDKGLRMESRMSGIYQMLRRNRFAAGLGCLMVIGLLIGFMLGGTAEEEIVPTAVSVEPPIEETLPSVPEEPVPPDQLAEVETPPSQVTEDKTPVTDPEAVERESPIVTPVEEPVPVLQAQAMRPVTEQEISEGDLLVRERQRASAGWLAGAYRGGYTIQLMMLVSEQAQTSVARMLVDEDYRQIVDQLYILNRKTTPPTLFIFYGIYDTMDEAREARNNMPVFLRQHHPYPLSIAEALKKTER